MINEEDGQLKIYIYLYIIHQILIYIDIKESLCVLGALVVHHDALLHHRLLPAMLATMLILHCIFKQ